MLERLKILKATKEESKQKKGKQTNCFRKG